LAKISNQLPRLYGTAEFAVKREKLEWRCGLTGGRIADWVFAARNEAE